MIVIEAENISKRFQRQTIQPHTTLKSVVVDLFQRRRKSVDEGMFQALRGITLTVRQGQTLGLIGRNGSGKSTLLKVFARIYRPDRGKIHVHGRVGALLELGAGFHPEFSGRENVLINGIVLGLSKKEVRQRFHEIVRFAELEAFIDEPVKTYSSGMYMRLGFAVAVHANPDILLIDEILSVGDEAFQQKCFDKIAEFQRRGKTIVLVSHDLGAVERWSDEVLWLDDGSVQERGKPRRVIDLYRERVAAHEGKVAIAEHHRIEEAVQEATVVETPNRWGSQEVTIVSMRMFDAAGEERYVYQSGEQVRVSMHYRVQRQVEEPIFGVAILRGEGLWCYGSNTDLDGITLPPLGEEGIVEVLLERLDLIAGTYYLDVAVHARNGYPYDYHHQLYSFTVKSEIRDAGVFRVPHRWITKPSLSISHQRELSWLETDGLL
jgi:ABC-type polysaccharide/polyol phosphate transport system ATPase subunit